MPPNLMMGYLHLRKSSTINLISDHRSPLDSVTYLGTIDGATQTPHTDTSPNVADETKLEVSAYFVRFLKAEVHMKLCDEDPQDYYRTVPSSPPR